MAISSTDSAACELVESPCIRVCTLDDDDVCLGCFRDIAEICAWSGASDDERRLILEVSEVRRHKLELHD